MKQRIPYPVALQHWKRKYFLDALDEAGGHQGIAAELLGVHRNTLSRLLSEVGLTRQSIRSHLLAANHPVISRRPYADQEPHAQHGR